MSSWWWVFSDVHAHVFSAGPSLHPYTLWKPSLLYRLCHPFTWRKTQTAALALLPNKDHAFDTVADAILREFKAYHSASLLSGSGPTAPPLAIPSRPRRQPF